jgi:FdhD protein
MEDIDKAFRIHKTLRLQKGSSAQEIDDFLTAEQPLSTVIVYQQNGMPAQFPLSINMRTPGNDRQLITGFLLTEGIVSDIGEIDKFEDLPGSENPLLKDQTMLVHLKKGSHFDPEQFRRNFYATSSCGVCGKARIDQLEGNIQFIPARGKPQVSAELICELGEIMRPYQRIFARTGGIHATAIFDTSGNTVAVQEDVGRHNAMDKAVGLLAENGILPASDKIVSVSGRASFELVQKALIAGLPIMTAVGAPSDLAVDLAAAYGMTLIGFLKKDRFNVYCHPERILDFS